MTVYKGLTQNEVSYRDFYANKQWVLTESDSELGIRFATHVSKSYFYP